MDYIRNKLNFKKKLFIYKLDVGNQRQFKNLSCVGLFGVLI